MNRALVIRYGNPQIAGAIEAGMSRNNYLAERRKRIERDRRFEKACRRWKRKYSTRPANPVIGAILGVWGLLWLCVSQVRRI